MSTATTTVETATGHSQTLAEFRDSAAETLDRLRRTGETEAITVDGEVRAMLVPPAVYERLVGHVDDEQYYADMRQAIREHDDGKARPAREVFDGLRAKLLAMKAAQAAGATP